MKHTKFILDACCGPKNMWFNKEHPNVLYIDNRVEQLGYNKHDPQDSVSPDIVADFRYLPDEIKELRFKLIAWDIPHLFSLGQTSMFRKKYGCLNKITWRKDLKDGFNSLWRVLDDYGVLLLKFNDSEIGFNDLLSLFHTKPLFYNITSAHGKKLTKWFCFMKIPEIDERQSLSQRIDASVAGCKVLVEQRAEEWIGKPVFHTECNVLPPKQKCQRCQGKLEIKGWLE